MEFESRCIKRQRFSFYNAKWPIQRKGKSSQSVEKQYLQLQATETQPWWPNQIVICYLHKQLKQSSTGMAAQGCHGRMGPPITSDLLSLVCGFSFLDCRCDSFLLIINPLLQRCGKMWRAKDSYELNWSYFIKKIIGVQQCYLEHICSVISNSLWLYGL